jgi:hypothetical protein
MNLIDKTTEELEQIILEAREYIKRTSKVSVTYPSSLTEDQIDDIIEWETDGNVVESSIVKIEEDGMIRLECESRKIYMGE